MVSPTTSDVGLPLSNQTIYLTDTFELPKASIKTQLENLRAKITDLITTKTTILLAGEKAGSKLAKAKELNIPIITNPKELLTGDQPNLTRNKKNFNKK